MAHLYFTGSIDEGNRFLFQADVPIGGFEACKKDYSSSNDEFIHEEVQLCAGKKISPRFLEANVCNGDSNPCLIRNSGYKYGVFTRVVRFINWINYNLQYRISIITFNG